MNRRALAFNLPSRFALLAAPLIAAWPAQSAKAQSVHTWNGGTDSDWGNTANWNGASAPDGNDIVNLAGAAGGNLTNAYAAAASQYRLFFNSGAGAYTLIGPSTVTFFDFGGNAPKIENNSTATQTINFGVALNGTNGGGFGEINPVDGNLTFNGTVDLAGTTQLRVWGNNGKTVTFNGGISSSGNGGANSLSLNQNSTVILAAANSYGATTISAGTLQVGSGGTSGSLGAGAVTNNSALIFNRSDSFSVSNAITGTGSVTKQGSGTLTLTGANGYGATTISAGALSVGNGGTTGSLGSGPVTNNGSLIFNRSDAVTVASAISGTGSVTVNGAGTSTVAFTSNSNTYSGGTTVNAGVLSLTGTNNGNSSVGTGTLTINTGAIVRAFTHNSLGQGTGAALSPLVINGGAFEADQYNHINSITMTGGTLGIRSGVAQVDGMDMRTRDSVAPTVMTNASANTATISSKLTVNNATTFNVADGAAASDLTVSGAIVGGSSVTKTGAGVMTFNNQKTYTGNTVINGGILDLTGGGGANGTIRGTATVNTGGTLRLSTGDATGYDAATRLGIINLAGGTLNVNSTANQTLGNGVINMTGGSITGVATSNLDFFQTSSALNSLASATTSTVAGTKLNIRQTAGLTITTATGTTASGIDLDVSSEISSHASFASAPLLKAGTGTLRISAANTYSGATTVNGGRLIVSGTLRNTPSLSVASGATLELGATNIFVGGHGIALGNSRAINVNGGTLLMNTAMDARFGNVNLSNGATWTSNRALTAYDALLANTDTGAATVSVANTGGSTAASTMNGSGGIHLSGMQNFSVADVTGNASNDLVVAMRLDNAGLLGGTGGVTKTGAGTMLLNGQNTYTAGTVINGGTLAVDGNQQSNRLTVNHAVTVNNAGSVFEIRGVNALPTAASSVDVTVNAGSTLRVVTGGSAVLGASGTSHAHIRNLNLSGGTVDLTYSGAGTAYDEESFQLNGDVNVTGTAASAIQSALATSLQGVSLSGTRTFTVADVTSSAATDLLVSAEIEGGALTKAGPGTMTLTVSNSYGATTISAGTLSVGDGGTSGSLGTGAVTNNSSLVFNRSNSLSYGGAISGTGSLTKLGAGELTLTAAQSYTGATRVSAGKLTVANTGSLSASSPVTVSSGAIFNLNGTAGTVTVEDGGTLTGSGIAADVTLGEGSVLAPGNSPGILTTGNITTSGGVLGTAVNIEIGGLSAGSQFDQIQTTGSVTLNGGILTVSLINSFIPTLGDTFDIWLNDGSDAIAGTPGTFTGLADGSTIDITSTSGSPVLDTDAWLITYTGGTGNDIRLTYIPEPSSALLAGAAALLGFSRRRRVA